MDKEYNWRAQTDYRALPDPDYLLTHGVDPNTYENWQTAMSGESKSGSWRFWFRDSNTMYQGKWQDVISSRLNIVVSETWNTSVDSDNNLTVTVTTVITSIYRDDAVGGDTNTPGRNITIYRQEGGAAIWSATDNQIATNHTLLGSPLNVGTETFTIAPGDTSVVRSSLYLHNQTVGSSSFDDIWLGVQFRNPLPPEYIPGKVYDGAQYWLSHNRATNGHAKLYTGSAWSGDMKTVDGGTASGDPPEIWHSSSSRKNMRKIGTGA